MGYKRMDLRVSDSTLSAIKKRAVLESDLESKCVSKCV